MTKTGNIWAVAPTTRSRATNERLSGRVSSRGLFLDGGGCSQWARRYRDLVEQFVVDSGGLASLPEMKLSLIRRAAALTVESERMEGALAEGKSVDVDKLARASGHLRRIVEAIGLENARREWQ